MALEKIFCGRGKMFIGPALDAGTPPVLRWLGDVSKFSFVPKGTFEDSWESYSGLNTQNGHILKRLDSAVNFVLRHATAENLALGLWGENLPVTGSTVTSETLATNAIVGSLLALMHPKVSSVDITDSSATPITLVADVNYSLHADQGSIEILDLTTGGPYTQPFKAAYSYAAYTQVAALKTQPSAQFLRYEGTNRQDLTPVTVEIYNFSPNPIKNFDPLSDKIQDFEIDGVALLDPSKTAASALGQFGRILL